MVFDKVILTLTTTLFAAVVVAGCSSLLPPIHQEGAAGNSTRIETARNQATALADNAPLPRQPYDPAGKKIPYVAQPNPYTTAVTAIPQAARSQFIVASSLFREGKLKAAQTRFRGLTEKYPSLSGPWLKLGAIAEKDGKYDEAMKKYKTAISVNRNNVNAYIALGLLQRRQGQYSDAQNTYIEALHVWKDFPEAHLNLGILYDLYMNKPEDAQKHYEAYCFLTGNKDKKAHKWLAEVKQRTGILGSFIDIPPKDIAVVPVGQGDDKGTPSSAGSTS
jgi:tetratricopeptide (TPR) repeat protein